MKISKKQYLATVAIALALAGASVGAVNAATDESNKDNPMSALVQAIADNFNLNKDEVQAVFDKQLTATKVERQAQMAKMEQKREQEFAAHLEGAVTAGELTQAQADMITAKRADLKEARIAERKEIKAMTSEERKAWREEMKTQMEELKAWASENKISEEYLPILGNGRGRGGGLGMDQHNMGSAGGNIDNQ
jgi:hypothetical protein